MLTETRIIDAQSRLVIPETFANAMVVVEYLSDTELRVRRATEASEVDPPFPEDRAAPLTDRDRDLFVDLLANPPAPPPALEAAAARYKVRHG